MSMQEPHDAQPGQQSLQVALTAEHAADVRACHAGQDRVEHVYRSHGHAAAPLQSGHPTQVRPGHHWEALRPLEVDPAPPPVITFPRRWDSQRGRFCALASGTIVLHLLRARRAY